MIHIKPRKYFNSIYFWIILCFLIRFVGITNPPLETGHNWRQCTGLMVARNFLEVDNNILHPRIDDNNGDTGIIGMEFPSLNYLHYLIAKIFGYQHWYGRLINLIISSIGIFCFYKLVNKFCKHKIALNASLCLLFSCWFIFSRKMMPDTYCISLMFIGLWFAIQYLTKNKLYLLLGYILFSTLAVLSKIPAAIYFVLVLPILFFSSFKRKIKS